MITETDRIEKTILVRAPQARVWRAIAEAKEFGAWFGCELDGKLAPGARVPGRVIKKSGDRLPMELVVEDVEPERRLSFRWHPYAVDPKVDYSKEPMTLVVFELESRPDGTLVRVTESGFDALPPGRRTEALPRNTEGWGIQMKNIAAYVENG
jgi:uncharacterized protein YndB with AHSA1/START domain